MELPKVSLALSGGAIKGANQAGGLLYLEEAQVEVDVVTGTSVGALNGALFCQNETKTLAHIWLNEIKNRNKLNSELIADIFEASNEIYETYQILQPIFDLMGKYIPYENYGKVFSYYDRTFQRHFNPKNIHNFFDKKLLENSNAMEFLHKMKEEGITQVIKDELCKKLGIE